MRVDLVEDRGEAARIDVVGDDQPYAALRRARVPILLEKRRYSLAERVPAAVARLPFPDPRLTLGEAMLLSKGRTPAHRALRKLIAQIVH